MSGWSVVVLLNSISVVLVLHVGHCGVRLAELILVLGSSPNTTSMKDCEKAVVKTVLL